MTEEITSNRTVDEIIADIDDVHTDIFYEEMADFMNWDAYYKLVAKLRYLEKELEYVKNHSEVNNNDNK